MKLARACEVVNVVLMWDTLRRILVRLTDDAMSQIVLVHWYHCFGGPLCIYRLNDLNFDYGRD